MKGYAKLGLLMGEFPEVAIIRKFSALSAQNILYLQAELRNLEVDLRAFAEEDESSLHPDRKVYSCDWYALQDSIEATSGEGNDSKQWETVLKIRNVLEKYQKAVLRHEEMSRLARPMKRDLKFLCRWMERTDMGNVYLHGLDRTTWSGEEWKDDLVAVKHHAADNVFFSWVYDKVAYWYHQVLGRHLKKPGQKEHLAGTCVYHEALILGSTRIATTVLACMLPVASIAILYTVEDMAKRLGIIAALTAVFSLSLVMMTSGSLADIFAATAAFAAVQVVFIGTSSPGSSMPTITSTN